MTEGFREGEPQGHLFEEGRLDRLSPDELALDDTQEIPVVQSEQPEEHVSRGRRIVRAIGRGFIAMGQAQAGIAPYGYGSARAGVPPPPRPPKAPETKKDDDDDEDDGLNKVFIVH